MKALNSENLKQVQSVCFYERSGTISISIAPDGDGNSLINLAQGGQDDKVPGFDWGSFHFVVRLMEQFVGYRFEPVGENKFRRTSIRIQ
jgi:hypothetical protein